MERFAGRLRVPLPEGWRGKESLTLLAPDGRANIIASLEPIPLDFDSRRYAEAIGEQMTPEGFPGLRILRFEPTPLMGNRTDGYLRVFEWDPPEEPHSVIQLQIYHAANGTGLTATATTPDVDYDRYEVQLLTVLAGITSVDSDTSDATRSLDQGK